MKNLTLDGVAIDLPTTLERYKALVGNAPLKERHRVIFEEKFGIKDGIAKTYTDVAKKFNISSTRVQQLCAFVFFKVGIES